MHRAFFIVGWYPTVRDEGVFGCFLYCSQVVVAPSRSVWSPRPPSLFEAKSQLASPSRDGLVLYTHKKSVKFVCPHAPKGLRMPVIRVSAIEIHAEDMYA